MKNKKLTKFFLIQRLLVVCLVVIIIVATVFTSRGCGANVEQTNYYFVYAKKCDNLDSAGGVSKSVFDSGGAGVIFTFKKQNYVIISAYFNKNDAKTVQNAVNNIYPDAGIIEICGAKGDVLKKLFSKNWYFKNYYQLLIQLAERCYEFANNYELSKIDSSTVYGQMINFRQKVVEMANVTKIKTDDLCSKVYVSSLVVSGCIDDFYSSAFVSSSISKYLRKLMVLTILEWQQLNNL